jgi:uncharacterized protein with ATP-grasp and redox domains
MEKKQFPFVLKQPRSPIPLALMVSEPGSFAQYTLRERFPAILQRAIAENSFSQSAVTNLDALATELLDGVIRPIQADGGTDGAAWAGYMQPFQDNSWFDTPFYFAEAYFYRRILEAISYFQVEPDHRCDPYAGQKQQSLVTAIEAIRTIASQRSPATPDVTTQDEYRRELIRLLHLALWGNRVDLSLWSAEESSRIRTQVEQEEAHLLVNDSDRIVDYLSQTKICRLDIVADNAGFELVCDLVLVDFLLSSLSVEIIYLHLKPYPIFVSDAMVQDVHHTLTTLAVDPQDAMRSLAARLQSFVAMGHLGLQDDLFWVAPLPFWEMLQTLQQELAQSSLVIIKGDANYRRLAGDCHWAMTTPIETIVNYFPAPLVALRTLKSEVVVGLRSRQIEQLDRDDPDWCINGQWGVIHFVNPLTLATVHL